MDSSRSSLSCRWCKTHFSKYQENQIISELESKCQSCLRINDEFDVTVGVRKSSAKFMQIAPVRSATWYHSTRVDDWGEKIQGTSSALYIGSYASAMNRYKHTNSKFFKGGWLYKVKLKDGVKIHPTVRRDDYVDRDITQFPDRVMRYVNLFECPGSISLIVRSNHFDIIDCKELP